ncbi:hypothetical protein BC939DRAFT_461434 [Gamsiella multidivaricata]|uniref:uncharacterized protein n=1 Tax=Gamsiella multidivaricata TaxID=101098 RepID=UPI002220A02C|nr:uncharacterized protein BC939DRAFT_461434 [Gamsiella multidivaricata]KAI7818916.1 hypothetical protein BC939DRAFT_461434 [Gamsiella multidivaricata]
MISIDEDASDERITATVHDTKRLLKATATLSKAFQDGDPEDTTHVIIGRSEEDPSERWAMSPTMNGSLALSEIGNPSRLPHVADIKEALSRSGLTENQNWDSEEDRNSDEDWGSDESWGSDEGWGSDEDKNHNEDKDYNGNRDNTGDRYYNEDRDYNENCISDDGKPAGVEESALSAVDVGSAIVELATMVFDCAVNGTTTGIDSQCVAVMSKVRRIPSKGSRCRCSHCFMQAPWRSGPVAGMNGNCGAYAWGIGSGLVVGPGVIDQLVEQTWESVSNMVDRWGQLVGSKVCVADYRTINHSDGGMSFSPLLAAEIRSGIPYVDGMTTMAIGCEGMLNGAGMYEHYPATGDYEETKLMHDGEHRWIDCAGGVPRTVIKSLIGNERYACVSHTWGRGWCKGTCGITGEYQEKHVCKWGYWDERDIAAAVIATGWDSELWLDWVDVPTQAGLKKANKIKAQAELYADASRVFVFVPEHDFLSIKGALDLSETADTFDEFLEVIHLLGGVKWFTSTWTLQEMFMSYERMMVVTHGGKSIECGWLVTLQARLGALLDRYWMCLKATDMTTLLALGVLELGDCDPGRLVAAALMRCRGMTHDCCDSVTHERCGAQTHDRCGGGMHDMGVFDSIRYELILDVPGGLPACAQLIGLAVQQHDVSWLAFEAAPAKGRIVPVSTMPMYGAKWPAAGRWQTICDLLATGAGLLWFGATGTVTLSETIHSWYDEDFASEGVSGDKGTARVIVLCVRDTDPANECWLGMLISGVSGRTRRVGGCVLKPSQMQTSGSGAVLVV